MCPKTVSLYYWAISALLILSSVEVLQSFRKEGMCKRCSCERLVVQTNQTLKMDCSRLVTNDAEDLLGRGKGEYGGVWLLPYEASKSYKFIKIILDANSIHHLWPLPPLKEETKNTSTENATEPTGTTALEEVSSPTAALQSKVSRTRPKAIDLGSSSYSMVTPLIELSFRSNDMKRIEPGAFASFSKTLWSIDLADNDLTYDALPASAFRGEFSKQRYEPLLSLEKLDLSRNMLHSLDAKIFEHVADTLQDLNLQGNALGDSMDTVAEHALSTLKKLKVLNLADVGISSFPEGLAHALISLKHLRLDGNKLTTVPTSLSFSSSSLSYLSLNRNPIKNLGSSSFIVAADGSPWNNLEALDVSAMPELQYVFKGAFENLSGLRILRCAYNHKLIHFDDEAFRPTDDDVNLGGRWREFKLRELHLQGNRLTWLAADVVPWNELDSADLQSNPWFCDCSLKPLADAIRLFMIRKTPNMSVGLLCTLPHHLRGVNFLTTYSDSVEANGTLPDDDQYKRRPAGPPQRLWSSCNGRAASHRMATHRGALSSALAAVAITATVSLLVVFALICVAKRSIRLESMNLPGQVRYVRAPPTKDEEDENVIMDMRWTAALKDNESKAIGTTPVVPEVLNAGRA